ncbi:MAG: response regulator [Archangiaceae bacterium]|nr:response regulator [Archangiaceae bacterium]
MSVLPRHVLVIDDSPLVQQLVREQLELAGFTVDSALDGDVGVERALASRLDAIVCDLSMPRRSGLETIRELKEVVPEVPIVVLTEQNEAQPAVAAMQLGAAAWVRKGDDLLGPLQEAVEKSRTETARRQRDKQIEQASSDTLDHLLDHLPDPMLVHREGVVLKVNPPLLKTFALPDAGRLLGRSLFELTTPEQAELLRTAIRDGLSGQPTPPLMIHARRFDGTLLELEVSTLPIRYHGQPASLTTLKDLTDRLRTEAKLVMTDRLISMGVLAASVAHEINNPLAYMFTNHEQLSAELGDSASPVVKEMLDDLVEGLQRIRTIVADLKGMSRDSETQGPVDLKREIEGAVRMAAPSLRTQAKLSAELQAVAPLVGQGQRLAQVFLNLFLNAAQAIGDRPGGGQVKVTLRDEGSVAVAEVSDDGPGMTAEVLARLFQPFFTTKPTGVGTGLGLHISKSIVEAHGGSISVQSAVGVGTTFIVRLPR